MGSVCTLNHGAQLRVPHPCLLAGGTHRACRGRQRGKEWVLRFAESRIWKQSVRDPFVLYVINELGTDSLEYWNLTRGGFPLKVYWGVLKPLKLTCVWGDDAIKICINVEMCYWALHCGHLVRCPLWWCQRQRGSAPPPSLLSQRFLPEQDKSNKLQLR